MAQGFKMGAAFVDVITKDNTKQGRDSIGSSMAQWAGGLALGATITKGITDNLDAGAATAKLAGQLNLTKEVSQRAGQIAGEVYRDNFGQSIPEVNAAIASVGQNMLNLNTASTEAIKGITEQALGLASTFDKDVNEVIRAGGVLVKTGLADNATQAMDQMTRAFQSGGDIAGDLLETIIEYSPQFKKLGFDGATALGVLSSMLKAGARDGDVVADVFKEFGLRAIDTAQLTTDGYNMIGLSADSMRQKIAAGGEGASQAMNEVLRALQNMTDPVAQNAAGVALFGTQWEDTLRAILPRLDLTESGLTDIEGATDRMNTAAADSAANGIESVRRSMEGWVTSMTNAEGPLGAISSWALGTGEWVIPLLGNIGMIIAGMSAMNFAAIGTAAGVVGSWIAMAAASVANAIIMAASWLLAFWPIALIIVAVAGLTALIVANWDTIKQWTIDTWNAVWKWVSDRITDIKTIVQVAINWIVQRWEDLKAIPGKVGNWFKEVGAAAKNKLNELVDWIKGIPGKIVGALGDLGRLLFNAGKKIIQGLWDGLKAMWNSVTDWVGDIAGWISDLKGPIELDAVILTPHGNAFMEGLQRGLAKGFQTKVKPTVDGMAGELANTVFPIPTVTPSSGAGAVPGSAPSSDSDRSRAIIVENLTVTFPGSLNAMSKTDLRSAAEFLNEELRQLNRGRVTA